jgi:hypothetical protein
VAVLLGEQNAHGTDQWAFLDVNLLAYFQVRMWFRPQLRLRQVPHSFHLRSVNGDRRAAGPDHMKYTWGSQDGQASVRIELAKQVSREHRKLDFLVAIGTPPSTFVQR